MCVCVWEQGLHATSRLAANLMLTARSSQELVPSVLFLAALFFARVNTSGKSSTGRRERAFPGFTEFKWVEKRTEEGGKEGREERRKKTRGCYTNRAAEVKLGRSAEWTS